MKLFHVVSFREWMHREVLNKFQGTEWVSSKSLGLDPLPVELPSTDVAVWAPQQYFVMSGPPVMASPGPLALTELPESILGREVEAFTARKLLRPLFKEGFYKPADVKLDSFPAKWYKNPEELRIALLKLDPESPVLYCHSFRRWEEEWRLWIVDGKVVTYSLYAFQGRNGQIAWDHPDFENSPVLDSDIVDLLKDFAENAVAKVDCKSFVVDIGWDSVFGWEVIELNPVWSSAWYDGDLIEIAEAILHSQNDVPVNQIWSPDPSLIAKKERRDRVSSRR